MPFLLTLLSRYWKPLAIAITSIALISGAYFKGYEHGKNTVIQKVEHTTYVEVEKRHEDTQRETERIDHIQERIRKAVRSKPIDDKRDSCLLSNDPFESECVQ